MKIFNMKLNKAPFENIKSGKKLIEFRLNDEKRSKLKPGDIIIFSLIGNITEKVYTEVLKTNSYPSLEDLYNNEGKFIQAYSPTSTKEKFISAMENIYSSEKREKYPPVAIYIKLIKSYKLGNTKEENDKLLALVKNSEKTATCSLYDNNNQSLVGEKYYITNSNETERILVQIKDVKIKKFCEVEKDFAIKEGEGDLSLEYWRETHREFFGKELEKQGKKFNEDIILECEEFEVIK